MIFEQTVSLTGTAFPTDAQVDLRGKFVPDSWLFTVKSAAAVVEVSFDGVSGTVNKVTLDASVPPLRQATVPIKAQRVWLRRVSGDDPAVVQVDAGPAASLVADPAFDFKSSVRAATTANIALSGTPTVDGVALVAGDRVLVKNQTVGSQNGIYVVSAGGWTRAPDADASSRLTPGTYVWVEEGTVNGDSGWALTTDAPITLDTTALTFTQVTGLGQVTAGSGLSKTGNQLSVDQTFAFTWTGTHTWSGTAPHILGPTASALAIRGQLATGDTGTDVIVGAKNARTAGNLFAVGETLGGTPIIHFAVQHDGQVQALNAGVVQWTIGGDNDTGLISNGPDHLTLCAGLTNLLGVRVEGGISKLGVFNVSTNPVARPAAYTQTYATATRTHSNPTGVTVTDSSGGTPSTTIADSGGSYSQSNQNNFRASVADQLNKHVADIANIKQLANQILDDLQAYGWFL